jgi:hypothetical protein
MLEIWRHGLVVVIFKAYNVMGKFYVPFSPPTTATTLNPWFVIDDRKTRIILYHKHICIEDYKIGILKKSR